LAKQFADLAVQRGIGRHALAQILASARNGPQRHHRRLETRGGSDVRILIRGDLLSSTPSFFDHRRCLPQLAPVRFETGLEVRDVDRQARAAPDLDGLTDRFDQPVPLAADVTGVQAAVSGDHAGHFHKFVDVGSGVPAVIQAGRQAPSARLHGAFGLLLQPFQLVRRRAPSGVAHGGLANRTVACQVDDIRADPVAFQLFEVLADIGGTQAAVAGHNGAAALGQVVQIRAERRLGQAPIAVRVQVDKAWRDRQARAVDDPARAADGKPAHRDNLVAAQRDVAHRAVGARPVEQRAAPQQHVGIDAKARCGPADQQADQQAAEAREQSGPAACGALDTTGPSCASPRPSPTSITRC